MSNSIELKVNSDFDKARNKVIFSKMISLFKNEEDTLFSFNEVKSILKPKASIYKGIIPIKISHIVGSEGRYRDFNKHFFPKASHLRSRWVRVNKAHYKDIILPPIRVYEIGGVYFVRDGNHRVSVGKTQGNEFIDAEVLALDSELKLDPAMTREDIKKAVIKFEKKRFMAFTKLQIHRNDHAIDFTSIGRYDDLINHINGHKYYMNLNKSQEIPFKEAMLSWYDKVFLPILCLIEQEELLAQFPGRTPCDLYVWISRHWHALKTKYGEHYTLQDAATDFSKRHGRRLVRRTRLFFKQLWRRIFHKKQC